MEPNPYGAGGAGGKIRRRPSRSNASTPYDRPSAPAGAGAPAAAPASGGWLSRLVSPASRLLYGGASKFISTFAKRSPALPAPEATPSQAPEPQLATPAPAAIGGEHRQSSHDATEGASIVAPPHSGREKSLPALSGDEVFLELEQLLLQKTYTRAEFDHLTNLLRSRTVESVQLKALSQNNHDQRNELLAKDNDANFSKFGGIGNHMDQAAVSVDEHATPMELAKAYMYSTSARGSPAVSLRSKIVPQNRLDLSHTMHERKLLGGPSASESRHLPVSLVHPQNGYTTPRGRSAIYRMARSPYFKGSNSSKDSYATPFASLQTPSSIASGNNQSLKRRSAVLDPEIGTSDSAIRRIRQKPNVMSQLKSTETSSPSFLQSPKTTQVNISTEPLNMRKDAERNNLIHEAPPQSSRTAEQIFKHLEEITRPPKDKFLEVRPDKSDLLPAKRQGLQSNYEESSMKVADSQQHQEPKSTSPVNVPGGSSLEVRRDTGVKLNGVLGQFANSSPSAAIEMISNSSPDFKSLSGRRHGFQMIIPEVSMEADDDCQPAGVPLGNAVTAPNLKISEQQAGQSAAKQNGPINVDQKATPSVPCKDEQKSGEKVLDQKFEEKVVAHNGDSRSSVEKPFQFPVNKYALSDKVEAKEPNLSFSFPVMRSKSPLTDPPPTPTVTLSLPALPANGSGPATVSVFSFAANSTSTPSLASTSAAPKANFRSTASDGLDVDKGNGNSHEGEAPKFTSSFSAPTISFGTSSSGLSNGTSQSAVGFSFSSVPATETVSEGVPAGLPPFSDKSDFMTKPTITSVSTMAPAFPTIPSFQFSSGTSLGSHVSQSDKSDTKNAEKPILFGTVSATSESKLSSLQMASTPSSLLTQSAPLSGAPSSSAEFQFKTTSSTFSTAGSSIFLPTFGAQSQSSTTDATNSQPPISNSVSLQTSTAPSTSIFANSAPQSQNGMPQSSQGVAGTFSFRSESSPSGFGGSIFGSSTSLSNTSVPFSFTSPSTASQTPQTMAAPSLFSSTSTASTSSPFNSTFGVTSSSLNLFAFGHSTSSGSSTSVAAQSAPAFQFGAAASMPISSSAPVFGTANNTGFGTASPGFDQMSEDAMADDSNQPTPAVPLFGQSPSTPAAPVFGAMTMQPNSVFGAPGAPLGGASPFTFGSNNGATPLNPVSFQASPAAPEFQGTFSLGSGGVDKSNRKIIRVTGRKQKKKL